MSNHIRTKNKRCLIVFFVVVFSWPAITAGTEYGGTAGSFLQSGIGVKAMGMGDAFTAIADDGSALLWNPGGLASKKDFELTFMHSVLYEDRSKNFGAIILPLPWITVSGGWLGLHITDIEERDSTDNLIGHFQSSENVFLLGGGISIISNSAVELSLGVTAKFLYNALYEYTANGFGIDVGTKLTVQTSFLVDKIEVGMIAKNLGANMNWNTESGYEATIPKQYRIGTAFSLIGEREYYTKLAVEIKYSEYEKRVTYENIGYGLELGGLNFLTFRVGYNGKSISAGAGFNIDLGGNAAIVDYAFTPDVISVQGVHNFSIGFRF